LSPLFPPAACSCAAKPNCGAAAPPTAAPAKNRRLSIVETSSRRCRLFPRRPLLSSAVAAPDAGERTEETVYEAHLSGAALFHWLCLAEVQFRKT
jgi:hypothetical protein